MSESETTTFSLTHNKLYQLHFHEIHCCSDYFCSACKLNLVIKQNAACGLFPHVFLSDS